MPLSILRVCDLRFCAGRAEKDREKEVRDIVRVLVQETVERDNTEM